MRSLTSWACTSDSAAPRWLSSSPTISAALYFPSLPPCPTNPRTRPNHRRQCARNVSPSDLLWYCSPSTASAPSPWAFGVLHSTLGHAERGTWMRSSGRNGLAMPLEDHGNLIAMESSLMNVCFGCEAAPKSADPQKESLSLMCLINLWGDIEEFIMG